MSFFKGVRTASGPSADRVCLYGSGGVGKTSAAVSFPKAVVIPVENGLDALPHVPRFDNPAPTKWEDVESILDEWITDTGKIPYKSLVIDTMDALELWCWSYVCAHNVDPKTKKKWDSIESPGWGKGYVAANLVWRTRFFPRLDKLHAKGINIVLLAHSLIQTYKNPKGDDYDRHQLKLHKGASKLMYEWVADQFYCEHYNGVSASKSKGMGPTKTLGMSTNERIAHTVWDAAWDAKHRRRVPEEIVMPDPYEGSFYAALCAAREAPEPQIKEESSEETTTDERESEESSSAA